MICPGNFVFIVNIVQSYMSSAIFMKKYPFVLELSFKNFHFFLELTVIFLRKAYHDLFNIISGNMGKSQVIRFYSKEIAEFDIKKLIWKTVNFVFSHFGSSGIIFFNPSFETKRLCELEFHTKLLRIISFVSQII